MVPQTSVLLALVDLIDVIPSPPIEARGGRPPVYSDRLFFLIRAQYTVTRHRP